MLAKFSLRSGCRATRSSAVFFASFLAALVMLTAAPLRAANYSWTVSAGDWSVASNWGGALLPSSSNDAAYVVDGGPVDGYSATLAVQANTPNQELVLNVAPEPPTLVLLAAGAIGLLGYGLKRL